MEGSVIFPWCDDTQHNCPPRLAGEDRRLSCKGRQRPHPMAFHVFNPGLGINCPFQNRPGQTSPASSLRLQSAPWPAAGGGRHHRESTPSSFLSSRSAWAHWKTKQTVSPRGQTCRRILNFANTAAENMARVMR